MNLYWLIFVWKKNPSTTDVYFGKKYRSLFAITNFINSLWARNPNLVKICFAFTNELILSQFCICHDNWATIAYAKFWPHWTIWIKIRLKKKLMGIQSWLITPYGVSTTGSPSSPQALISWKRPQFWTWVLTFWKFLIVNIFKPGKHIKSTDFCLKQICNLVLDYQIFYDWSCKQPAPNSILW